MKKVLKFVKGRKDEKRDSGGITPSQSGDLISSPAQTPEDEAFLGLDSGYSVDFSGKDKTLTKLHKAAWQGNLEKLKSALKKVEIDAVDRHNRTALHFAVAQGHPNIVWFLLGNNAKTSICDDEGHTPLLKAIECGHKECMTLLLDRGADVNVTDYTGNTGLHIAVSRASIDTVSALLKKSADSDISNNAGDYPLHIATKLENKDLVDLLLDAGASVDVLDRENRTPLMLAAKTGNRVLAELFVEKGAQLTVVDSNGWTAQDYAMLGEHEHIAATLSARNHKKTEEKVQSADSTSNSESWGDSQTEMSEKELVTQKLKKMFDKCSEEVEKEKNEEPESPDAEAIPPFCQPPRSWEMIQAGMIDQKQNGGEPKRRSITALGTLHSRRESFTEALTTSPKSTLSLNRRRNTKEHNAFAKHRFSLNEEASLCHWLEEENKKQKELQEALCDKHSTSGSDWDSVSAEDSKKGESEGSGGTLGRNGTMLGVEELWIANSHASPEEISDKEKCLNSWDSEGGGSPEGEKSFPPPPSGLELGVDMAKSIRSVRGLSVDQSSGRPFDRNLWKNVYESHSLDRLEEKDFERSQSEQFKCLKPRDKVTDVSRRINEQLECYDQALRELAESSKKRDALPAKNYYSLPSKSCDRDEWRRMSYRESSFTLPPRTDTSKTGKSDKPDEDKTEKAQKKKRHMLLAMRDIKHALHVANNFKSSMDDQILSPLAKPGDSFDSDEKSSPRGVSSSSGGNSPADENPFFGIGRQETVLERNDGAGDSEGSGTGEESTLWLQDEAQKKDNSDEDVPDIAADGGSKHKRESSFSPLGVIHREMEEESRAQREQSAARGENEEVAEQSPDVSLSSGPIEPLGAEKDSGSEPESSHNDLSPTHNYALKSQHEWLKCHLKAATSEKNKLEELTAQLSEKAERLQYELADAKEAAKSRDEVIQLLQGQLARMEAAYTKSLEESVQSRLQLTSHEQEILHLKELCYRYQEEKEATTAGGGDFLQELQTRIKTLEEEKEKMKEEIAHLEEEKSLLEVRLRTERQQESDMMDQCQRWKERCEKLEEMLKHYDSKQSAFESYVKEKDGERLQQECQLKQANAALEKKVAEARDENAALKKAVERAEREMEELRRRNAAMEKEMEDRIVRKLKEKEEEVGGLVAQFNRERESLLAAHASEKRLMERRTEDGALDEEWRRENERLRQAVQKLRDELTRLQVNEGAESAKPIEWGEIVRENVKLLSKEMKEIKARVSAEAEQQEKKKDIRKRIGKDGELAWSNLYGMKTRRRDSGRLTAEDAVSKADRQNILSEIITKHEKSTTDLEFLQLKKQILSLESKMSDEKNLRHALENEMIKMRVNLHEKENLEMEVDALKRKVGRHCAGRSGAELVEYERQLQAKREKYLEDGSSAPPQRDDFKARCEALAKEREKVKHLAKSFDRSAKILCQQPDPPVSSTARRTYSPIRSQMLLQPRQQSLDPDLKNKLDYELDKSIRKHMQESSIPSVSNVQM